MSEHSNRNGKIIIIIAVVVLLLAGAAAAWYFVKYKPEQEALEKARLEQIAKQEAEKKKKEEAEAEQKAKYDKLIKDADAAFAGENWGAARSLYTEASALFSDQQYPKDQLVLVKVKLDELAALEANRAAGIIEMVSSPAGRFFVIVSSSIDDDLAMDYANKLSKEGNNLKIIEPNPTNFLFHRVSIGDYETREQAERASTSFGGEAWVLKY